MKYQFRRLAQLLLLMTVAFFLITACHYSTIHESNTPPLHSAKCKIVQHKLGETCIPIQPQRIVALDPPFTLDPLLALNVKPAVSDITIRGGTYWGALSTDDVAGIEIVGQLSHPSLEKILTLKPDLILGTNGWGMEQNYGQLSAIAPTVLMDLNKVEASFKEHLRFIAQVVGRQERAEEVLNQYQNRVKTLQKNIGNQSKEVQVSVIQAAKTYFFKPGIESLFFQIMNDIGINIKPIFLQQPKWSTFSMEVINEYDADVVFILSDPNESKAFYLENLIISSLKSSQNGQLYIVDSFSWLAYGPSAWNKILDDLFRYLLEDT